MKDILGTVVATAILVVAGFLIPVLVTVLGTVVLGYVLYKVYQEGKARDE